MTIDFAKLQAAAMALLVDEAENLKKQLKNSEKQLGKSEDERVALADELGETRSCLKRSNGYRSTQADTIRTQIAQVDDLKAQVADVHKLRNSAIDDLNDVMRDKAAADAVILAQADKIREQQRELGSLSAKIINPPVMGMDYGKLESQVLMYYYGATPVTATQVEIDELEKSLAAATEKLEGAKRGSAYWREKYGAAADRASKHFEALENARRVFSAEHVRHRQLWRKLRTATDELKKIAEFDLNDCVYQPFMRIVSSMKNIAAEALNKVEETK